MRLSLAYSPCPNDTFMFHAIAGGLLRLDGCEFDVHLHDVETLNNLAFQGRYDITKLSFSAYLAVRGEYKLLNCGAALGYGCGPIVVARSGFPPGPLPPGTRAAVPGRHTTAHLLFGLWAPQVTDKTFVTYDQVMPMVASGQADCGMVIHEGRFVYRQMGLEQLADLGQWWERTTALPIPLGCVVARRSLGDLCGLFEELLRRSIAEALTQPQRTMDYVRSHARELDDDVIKKHISAFVNDFSLDLGPAGRLAVERLEQLAAGGRRPT